MKNQLKVNNQTMAQITEREIKYYPPRGTKISWNEIKWKIVKEQVGNLQEKIVIATQKNNYKEVYDLQRKIITSFSGCALAIRKVVTNSGSKTAGIDKIKWEGSKDYTKAISRLKEITAHPGKYHAQPLKRVWIPKANSDEKRPLVIPTLIDRAVQAVYQLAVDPAVETKSDRNSYGFRKHRSTHDAITAVRNHMDKVDYPRYILETDIRKCFDRINHEFLMKNTPICDKHVLDQWLKSGVMENRIFQETEAGTPQGGIISPVLCNIALNGIEGIIHKAFPLKQGISAGIHVIRYADDMITTGKSIEILLKAKIIIGEFLAERGLELNEKKTKITHIMGGFDFLGFRVIRKRYNPKLNNPTNQDTVLIIKPSKKGVDNLKAKIKGIIKKNTTIQKIVWLLNPILRGWGEHKRISYHTQETFIKLDHYIWTNMVKWTSRHSGSKRKAIARYVISTATRKWNWGKSLVDKLINLSEIPIIQLRPLKMDRNPYVPEDKEYFQKRREKLVLTKYKAAIYKLYKHLCPGCGETLHNGERIELHHILPPPHSHRCESGGGRKSPPSPQLWRGGRMMKKGGKHSKGNVMPLHQICHQQISHGKNEN